MYIHVNPNPNGMYVEDCVVRAICIATGRSWDDVYLHLCLEGFIMKNMPSVNNVWGTYLKSIGFVQHSLPTDCPNCYTVRDFCSENRNGIYILATGSHVVAAVDGNYCDAWDSGDEVLEGAWRRENYARV